MTNQEKYKQAFSVLQTSGDFSMEVEKMAMRQKHHKVKTIAAATGMNITRLRINAGLSVKDLADIFGFATPQAVYKWQHGVAMPTLDNLVVLAAVFGVSMDEIIAVDVNAKAQISA